MLDSSSFAQKPGIIADQSASYLMGVLDPVFLGKAMGSGFWADVIVAFHAAYVGYVVVGQIAIVAGGLLGWQWIRNPWFRFSHLAAITLVAGEALLGIACPLTVWEDQLRLRAGQEVTGDSLIGRWLHHLIFYDFPPWAFTLLYVGFALLVLGSLFWVPPRRRRTGRVH